jgi:hypothetical protein
MRFVESKYQAMGRKAFYRAVLGGEQDALLKFYDPPLVSKSGLRPLKAAFRIQYRGNTIAHLDRGAEVEALRSIDGGYYKTNRCPDGDSYGASKIRFTGRLLTDPEFEWVFDHLGWGGELSMSAHGTPGQIESMVQKWNEPRLDSWEEVEGALEIVSVSVVPGPELTWEVIAKKIRFGDFAAPGNKIPRPTVKVKIPLNWKIVDARTKWAEAGEIASHLNKDGVLTEMDVGKWSSRDANGKLRWQIDWPNTPAPYILYEEADGTYSIEASGETPAAAAAHLELPSHEAPQQAQDDGLDVARQLVSFLISDDARPNDAARLYGKQLIDKILDAVTNAVVSVNNKFANHIRIRPQINFYLARDPNALDHLMYGTDISIVTVEGSYDKTETLRYGTNIAAVALRPFEMITRELSLDRYDHYSRFYKLLEFNVGNGDPVLIFLNPDKIGEQDTKGNIKLKDDAGDIIRLEVIKAMSSLSFGANFKGRIFENVSNVLLYKAINSNKKILAEPFTAGMSTRMGPDLFYSAFLKGDPGALIAFYETARTSFPVVIRDHMATSSWLETATPFVGAGRIVADDVRDIGRFADRPPPGRWWTLFDAALIRRLPDACFSGLHFNNIRLFLGTEELHVPLSRVFDVLQPGAEFTISAATTLEVVRTFLQQLNEAGFAAVSASPAAVPSSPWGPLDGWDVSATKPGQLLAEPGDKTPRPAVQGLRYALYNDPRGTGAGAVASLRALLQRVRENPAVDVDNQIVLSQPQRLSPEFDPVTRLDVAPLKYLSAIHELSQNWPGKAGRDWFPSGSFPAAPLLRAILDGNPDPSYSFEDALDGSFAWVREGAGPIQESIRIHANVNHATEILRFIAREISGNPGEYLGVAEVMIQGPRAAGILTDNIILYLDKPWNRKLDEALELYGKTHPGHILVPISPMKEWVAPGISRADEPTAAMMASADAILLGELLQPKHTYSFETIRSYPIFLAYRATAKLLGTSGDPTFDDTFYATVYKRLAKFGVDPNNPARNLETPHRLANPMV